MGGVDDLGNVRRLVVRLRAAAWVAVFKGAAGGCRECCELIVADLQRDGHIADKQEEHGVAAPVEGLDGDVQDARQCAGGDHFAGLRADVVTEFQRLIGREIEIHSGHADADIVACAAHGRLIELHFMSPADDEAVSLASQRGASTGKGGGQEGARTLAVVTDFQARSMAR